MLPAGFPRGEQPQLQRGLLVFWEAYCALSSRRTVHEGGVPGSIPLSEVAAYCEVAGFDEPIDRSNILRMVDVLDQTYHEQQERTRKSNEKLQKSLGKR